MGDLDFTGALESFSDAFSLDAGTKKLFEGSHNAGTWATSSVSGLKELERNLNELPDAIAKKVLRKAVVDGAEIFRGRASAGAPHDPNPKPRPSEPWKTKHLSELIMKSVTIRNNGVQGVTIRGKIGLDKMHAFYGRYLEKGWTDTGGNKHEPRDFMLAAYESMKGTVLALFEVRLREGIERETKRLHSQ